MEGKVMGVGRKIEKKLAYISGGLAILCFLASLILASAIYETDWNDYYDSFGEFMAERFSEEPCAGLLILAITLAIFAIIFILLYSCKCKITVTDKLVCAKDSWGRCIEIPVNRITSIGKGWFKRISVRSSSGKIKMYFINSRDELYDEIKKLLENI